MPPSIQPNGINAAAAAVDEDIIMTSTTAHDDDPASASASDADEEEYETSYSKFASNGGGSKSTSNRNNVSKPRIRRRRGGYGNSASVLEALPTQPKSALALEEEEKKEGNNNNNNGFAMDVDDFDIDISSSANKPKIFMQTQDDDDESQGINNNNDDDDDATLPYVDSDTEMADVAAEGHGKNVEVSEKGSTTADDDASDAEAEAELSEMERPRGRTKQSKGKGKGRREASNVTATVAVNASSEETQNANAQGDSKDEEERLFPQSEASGYGFSLGADHDEPDQAEASSQSEQAGDQLLPASASAEVDYEESQSEKRFPQMSQASGYGFSQGPEQLEAEESQDVNEDCNGDRFPVSAFEPAADASSPADDSSSVKAPTSDEKASSPELPESNEPTPTTTAAEPTTAQILRLVDALFLEADKDSITVGDINREVVAHFGWEDADKKVLKKRKKIIKGRLTDLIMGTVEAMAEEEEEENDVNVDVEEGEGEEVDEEEKSRKEKKSKKKKEKKSKRAEPQSDEDEEEPLLEEDYESEPEVNDDDSSDYEDARPKKRGGNKSKSKKNRRKELMEKEYSDADSDASFDEDALRKSKKKRSKKSSKGKKGKMAKHLQDRHTKARLRQIEESRIRKEELGHLATNDTEVEDDKKKVKKGKGGKGGGGGGEEKMSEEHGPQLSEEDKQRALAIAARFDTNSEELRQKRMEDRLGLIGRLRAKRLQSIESVDLSVESIQIKGGVKAEVKAQVDGEAQEGVKAEDGMPRLTSSSLNGKVEDNVESKKAMIDLGDDDDISEEEDSDDDDDDDLEIIAPPKKPCPSNESTIKDTKQATENSKSSSRSKKPSAMDLLFSKINPEQRQAIKSASKPKTAANAKIALMHSLRAKKKQKANSWLASELGYTKPKDHARFVRDCTEAEEEKRKNILLLEKEAALHNEKKEALAGQEVTFYLPDEDDDEEEKEFVEEEDEEMAMARKMGQLDEETGDDNADAELEVGDENDKLDVQGAASLDKVEGPQSEPADDSEEKQTNKALAPNTDDTKAEDDAATPAIPSSPSKTTSPGSVVTPLPGQTEEVMPDGQDPAEEEAEMEMADTNTANPFDNDVDSFEESADAVQKEPKQGPVPSDNVQASKAESLADSDVEEPSSQGQTAVATDASEEAETSKEIETEESPSSPASQKPKNSAWKAMLLKEKATLARQKKLQRKNAGLVQGEAEEEDEEDEGIAGLEDFGFSVEQKIKDDEDAIGDDIDEDDLEHVVDDVSDGEGDEEAGEAARLRLRDVEDKEQRKEIIRRMREGYDGRRGGIASGSGGARGMIRFDELVAAENREDAKRLGLLNDDEMDSDDEEGEAKDKAGDDEEEDEAVLLDKMLKDRFVNHGEEEMIEENFTDDESEDETDGAEQNNGEDDEDREQERMAKHFAKRARRNRILEEYEGDSQFSRSRLIDEDVSMQQDLKLMKTSFCRKRSMEGSNLDFKENNRSSKKAKGDINEKSSQDAAASTKPTSNFLSNEGSSLSVALMASRRISAGGRKRKTTFLSAASGKQKKTAFSRGNSSSTSLSSKSVSLNHVVFMAGDNSQSANSQLLDSRSNSFLGSVKQPRGGNSKARSKNASKKSGSSLWSKVCSKNFRTN